MVRNYLNIIILTLFCILGVTEVLAQKNQAQRGLLVWIKPGIDEPAAALYRNLQPHLGVWKTLRMEKAFRTQVDPLTRIFIVEGYNEAEENDLLKLIKSLPDIELAEVIPERHLSYTPNDLSSKQW